MCFLFCYHQKAVEKLDNSGNSELYNSLTEGASLDVEQFLGCL